MKLAPQGTPAWAIAPGAMRLILAMVVVATHYGGLLGVTPLVRVDGVAVYGFFFLSGYWVSRLWAGKYSHRFHPLATFYISRAWRIYPIATLSTIMMIAVSGATWGEAGRSLILFFERSPPWPVNPPTWSLAVELQFYAAAPFLFALMRRARPAAWITVAALILWVAFALGLPARGAFLPHFLCPFALGIIWANWPRHDLAVRLAPFSLALVLLAGIGVNGLAFAAGIAPAAQADRLLALIVAVAALPLIAASVSRRSDERDRVLGDLAYPIYVFHWPAWSLAALIAPGVDPLLASLVTMAALSWMAYRFVDRPLEAARRAWVDRRRSVPFAPVEEPRTATFPG